MTRFERLLSAIYSGIEHPEDWRDALEMLARLTRSRASGVFVVADGALRYDIDAGMPAEFMHEFRGSAALDPRLHYAAARPRHTLVSDDAPGLRPTIQAAGIDRFTRRFDLDYTAATVLADAEGALPVLYVSRSARQGPLPGAHAGLLVRLAPHLARALRLRAELLKVRDAEAASFPDQPRSAAAGHTAAVRVAPQEASGLPLPRQLRRVLAAIAAGQSNAEIAAGMGLSVNTVRTHVRRLFELSGARRRTALLHYATVRGWLP